jgi:hypothetical protein
MAVGFTWAHLIGDIPSAAACFSTWAQLLSGKKAPAPTLRDPHTKPPPAAPAGATAPPSVKAAAAPIGDDWRVPTACEMVSISFHVTEQQLKRLLLGGRRHHQVGTFELVAALVWRAVAAIRGAEEEAATRTVTVVKTADPAAAPGGGGGRLGLTNEHRIGHAVAPAGLLLAAAVADVAELAAVLAGASFDGAGAVAAAALAGADDADAVVYGANLTFVDAEGVDVYGGLELGARRPAHVEYAVDGAGAGGAAVVHRDAGGRGLTVAAAVRRGEADRLRAALRDALRVA